MSDLQNQNRHNGYTYHEYYGDQVCLRSQSQSRASANLAVLGAYVCWMYKNMDVS